MDFSLTSEQAMLKDSADQFLSDKRGDGPSWAAFAELGWLGLTLPEEAGGMGPAPVEVSILAEALGRNLVREPWVGSVVLAAGLFADVAPPAFREALLPGVVDGTVRLAFAHMEARSRACLSHVVVSARPDERGGWRLSGRKLAVVGGDVATHFLITARMATGHGVRDVDGIALFLLRRDQPGLVVDSVPGLDGTPATALDLDGTRLDEAALLSADAFAAVELAIGRALAAWCAESVGAMERLLTATVEYTSTRVQFGRTLAANQAVRHRIADMAVALEEARSLAQLAALTLDAAPAQRRRAVAAAKARVGRAARFVAEQAVQLHGAMGVTDELPIGGYLRRLLALDVLFGSADDHLQRHAELPCDLEEPEASGLLRLSAEDRCFRDEVRGFIADHLTPELRRAQDLTASVYAEPEVSQPWHRALHARGWVAPNWPREYGGTGWTVTQRTIFETEMSRAGAPVLHPQGLRLVGPVIMRFGTKEQKQEYLPRILSGEDYWCQGYSEPDAGSDLASLKTRAERDGEYYVVNGSKMWTTHAHHANRMFALVRTSQEPKRQDGISFLLIDMATPGITVRPIMTIGGDHEVNQVFLDNVRVPVANRVGGEGQGWSYGKFLLANERGSAIVSGRLRRALGRVEQLSRQYQDGERPLREDPVFAARLSETEIDIDALEVMELRVLSAGATDDKPGAATSSILKLRVSQLHQAVAQLGLHVVGADALMWEQQRPFYRLDHQGMLPDAAITATARYLDTRAYTIFGGTAEIQHDIIARSVIGS